MSTPFSIIIPARFASSRLPGKPLLEIKDKPLIQYVYESATKSDAARVIIATDDERISAVASAFDAEIVMTSTEHQSGTDRLAEVVEKLGIKDEIVVNLQGDEFGMPVSLLNQVANALAANSHKQMSTLCEPISEPEEYSNPNVVKVVFDSDNTALYFSRASIPANRDGGLPAQVYRHIGLYAYQAEYLQEFTNLAPCALEQTEALEQLRVLYHGGKIHVEIAVDKTGVGIDTEDDLALARTM